MNFKRYFATTLGIVLSVISAIFTCQMLSGFADSGAIKLVYIVMGILLQTSQAFTASLAAYCFFQGKIFKALPALVAWFFLVCLSLAGTMGSLSRENKTVADSVKYQSKEYEIMQSQVSDIEKQIQHTRKVIDDCTGRSIITRCVIPRQAELRELLAEKQRLQSKLMGYKAQYSGDEIYRRIAEFLDADIDEVKSAMYLLYALALDLLPALFLAYAAGLLAFRERDIFLEAKIRTEQQKQQTQQEYETVKHSSVQVQEKQSKQHRPVQIVEKRPVQVQTAHNDNRFIDSTDNKQPIGFNTNTAPSKDKNIETYVKCAFEHMKQGALCGRRKIGDLTGITQKKCDEYHSQLKKAGLVKVEKMKTFPVYDLEKTLQALKA